MHIKIDKRNCGVWECHFAFVSTDRTKRALCIYKPDGLLIWWWETWTTVWSLLQHISKTLDAIKLRIMWWQIYMRLMLFLTLFHRANECGDINVRPYLWLKMTYFVHKSVLFLWLMHRFLHRASYPHVAVFLKLANSSRVQYFCYQANWNVFLTVLNTILVLSADSVSVCSFYWCRPIIWPF